MDDRFLSRLRAAARMLVPGADDRAYLRAVRGSNLFDRQFYRSTNPRMHWLSSLFPERHYILRGEAMGLRPNPEFSPAAYLRGNPDLDPRAVRPFRHYVTHGLAEGRQTLDPVVDRNHIPLPAPRLRPIDLPQPPARFAVVVHLYYHEMWPEFAEILRRQTFDFDLFVTVVRFAEETDDVQAAIRADFPEAVVIDVPNQGRDILPFVTLVNAGALAPYAAVCKLHTKRSPHRQDGDIWRRHLIDGILGDPDRVRHRLDRFLADGDAAFWVADGQHYKGTEWWGSNAARTENLMRRIECEADPSALSFPAGSIYWVKPVILDMVRGMALTPGDFDPEDSQVDGTTAHAMERALGYISRACGMTILQASDLDRIRPPHALPRPRLVTAFYLPQFHPVPQNDVWWGPGFTEWHNVTRARAIWPGHGQPALPSDLGFYDLRLTDTMAAQAKLARAHGIDAFCVYHYWFDGARILEAPIDNLLARPEVDFPFYLCWANESWRRNWDGLSGDVLMPQSYAPGFGAALAESLVPYFADPRYLRPDGTRPRFVIYRPEDMTDPAGAVAQMRQTWRDRGVGEVELGAVRFHIEGEHPVAADLFDFWVEMPPHGLVRDGQFLWGGRDGNRLPFDLPGNFDGLVYDYTTLSTRSTDAEYLAHLPARIIAGIMPGWDNTARRGPSAHIAYGANPGAFRRWLRDLCVERLPESYRGELFVNAWNEWAEKAVMEPSEQYGDAYLRVLAEVCTPAEDG